MITHFYSFTRANLVLPLQTIEDKLLLNINNSHMQSDMDTQCKLRSHNENRIILLNGKRLCSPREEDLPKSIKKRGKQLAGFVFNST